VSSVAILRLTILLTCLVSLYQAILLYLGTQTSEEFETLWGFAFAALLVFWIDADSQGRSDVYRPSFDFGFFVYVAWIFYLPYYLIRTRGRVAWLWLIGLMGLVFLESLLQFIVYLVS